MKNMRKKKENGNNATSSNSSTLSDSSSVSGGVEEQGPTPSPLQRVAEWKMVPLTLIAGPCLARALATKAVWQQQGRSPFSVHCCFERS